MSQAKDLLIDDDDQIARPLPAPSVQGCDAGIAAGHPLATALLSSRARSVVLPLGAGHMENGGLLDHIALRPARCVMTRMTS
jgi:hypothetical protein